MLLDRVRAGDDAAYDTLYQRHEQAVRRLAGVMGPPADVDDVVADAFDHVLGVTRNGGGPSEAFRPYVLSAARQDCHDRFRTRSAARAGDSGQPGDPEHLTDPSLGDGSVIARAFRALPERWIAVLWHTEVEQESPAAVAPVLGLKPREVSSLKVRALNGLSDLYLRMRLAEAEVSWPGCRQVARRLVAFLRGTTSRRDRAMVTDHLSHCHTCEAVYEGLAELDTALRRLIAPIFLGAAAAAYLSASAAGAAAPAASEAATGDAGAAGAAATGDAGADGAAARSHGRVVRRLRLVSRSKGSIAACVAILGVAALVFGLALSGGGAPRTSAGANPRPQAAAPGTPGKTAPALPRQKKNQKKKAAAGRPAAPAAPPAMSPSSAATSPGGAPGPGAAAVQLSATVSVSASLLVFQQVAFTVTDTGRAPTGDLTASLTFPPGTLLSGVSADDSNGWTCQPTATGTSCQHGALPAGGQVQGAISLSALGSATCSEPVRLTVVSGDARAVAQYPDTTQC